jgi:hypothetical protein
MRAGNLRATGLAIVLALATLGLLGCGSGGGDSTATRPALSTATADHLAKLSERVASDLDAGETCTAAHDADELAAAVDDARLPSSIRPGVSEVASNLVDTVNCPPPPPAPEKKKKPKHEDHPKPDEHHGGEDHQGPQPPGHSSPGGGFVPPGQAKLNGEPG